MIHHSVVELNVSAILKLRDDLNKGSKSDISLLDLLLKATALAVKQVPDVNASWYDSFIRRYDQVDINLVTGGPGLSCPQLFVMLVPKDLPSSPRKRQKLKLLLLKEN